MRKLPLDPDAPEAIKKLYGAIMQLPFGVNDLSIATGHSPCYFSALITLKKNVKLSVLKKINVVLVEHGIEPIDEKLGSTDKLSYVKAREPFKLKKQRQCMGILDDGTYCQVMIYNYLCDGCKKRNESIDETLVEER